MSRMRFCISGCFIFASYCLVADAFSSSITGQKNDSTRTKLEATSSPLSDRNMKQTMLASILAVTFTVSSPVFADEIGVEKEAPTLFTGETVEICTKRGPLGACLKTELRTETNDNDIAKRYFRDPTELIRQKEAAMREATDDGNALIQKLKQRSIENQEKNDLYVARKTFEADQAATFGPFDRQVLIMNTDGRTFTLLENPVAMRLKKAGFIDNKRAFIIQPTQEDIDKASETPEGFFSGFLGGS